MSVVDGALANQVTGSTHGFTSSLTRKMTYSHQIRDLDVIFKPFRLLIPSPSSSLASYQTIVLKDQCVFYKLFTSRHVIEFS